MSRAFLKEDDGGPAVPALPDRPVGPQPNPVTRRGLKLIEAAVARHRREFEAAAAAGQREVVARASRELRYWTTRRASARLVEPEPGAEEAGFGMLVTVRLADGQETAWRIVGEGEAEPATGRISWASPVARSLRGAAVGEVVALPGGPAEVVAVDPAPESEG